MDYSSSVMAENLQCFICLEVSTDPINTPCGHIFCKACLKECWESSHDNTCPCCKQKFTKRVDLTHCEHLLSQSETLMWQSSNLEPLEKALNIQQVIMLVEDINPKIIIIIQNYNRALKMCSEEDQTSVIQSCTEGDHKTYNTVLVEDDIKEMKEMKMRKLVQQMIQEITQSEIKTSKKNTNDKKKEADDTELCTDLNFATEKCQELTILKPLQQMLLETTKIDQEIIHSIMKMLKKIKNKEKEEADHIELDTDPNCATKYQIQELKILKLVQGMIQDTVKMDQKISKKSEEKEKADNVKHFADLNYPKYQDDAF